MKNKLPDVQNVWIISDNATCYGNPTLSVILPFLGKERSIKIKSYTHSETHRGKGFVDAHLAVVMRHMNRSVNENGKDMAMPTDEISRLEWNGGIASSTAGLVNINRANVRTMAWVSAKRNGYLACIGRVNEIAYEPTNDCFKARLYTYIGSNLLYFS